MSVTDKVALSLLSDDEVAAGVVLFAMVDLDDIAK